MRPEGHDNDRKPPPPPRLPRNRQSPPRYGGSDEPSKAEKAALRWHKEHHRGQCWCCCRACKTENPHYAAACAAAMADIEARIRSSIKEMRMERRNGRWVGNRPGGGSSAPPHYPA